MTRDEQIDLLIHLHSVKLFVQQGETQTQSNPYTQSIISTIDHEIELLLKVMTNA